MQSLNPKDYSDPIAYAGAVQAARQDRTEAAINLLTDAQEYLRGREGAPPNPDAALDALREAEDMILSLRCLPGKR